MSLDYGDVPGRSISPILQNAVEQFNKEIGTVSDLFSPVRVDIDVIEDQERVFSMLSQQLDNNPFSIEFFNTHVLGENTNLVIAEIAGLEYLTIRANNLELGVSLFLPIKNINLTQTLEELVKNGGLVHETVDIGIEYKGMFWQGEKDFFELVDKGLNSLRYTSDGKRTLYTSTRDSMGPPIFISTSNGITSRKTKGIEFKIGLPINSKTIPGQLHELGHYHDLYIAGNSINLTENFRITYALSSILDFKPPSRPLDNADIDSLVNLKNAEVRAWLYGNFLLGYLGSGMQLMQTESVKSSLESYDRLLALQVLLAGEFEEMSKHFMFEEVATEQFAWMNTFKQLKSLLIDMPKTNKPYHIKDLEIEVESWGIGGIHIEGDDTTLQFLMEIDESGAPSIYIDWQVRRNGVVIRKDFNLNLNKYRDVEKYGTGFLENWIEMLEYLKQYLT